MKRWIIYLAVLALCSTSSVRKTDIGELAPVEAVWLSEKDGQVYLRTDTADVGFGADVQSAAANMKATASRTILLETADYLIVEQGREALIQQVYDILRPSCKICVSRAMPDMGKVVQFLKTHAPQITIRQYQVETNTLPILKEQEGRLQWLAK